MPDRLATVRAGDTVSRAGAWGNAVRYGGVQYATDFATQPNLVLTPGQFVAGQATVPSTVDVFVVMPVKEIGTRYVNYYGGEAQRFAA